VCTLEGGDRMLCAGASAATGASWGGTKRQIPCGQALVPQAIAPRMIGTCGPLASAP
tara:strand:- start:782 stop:952 length:171 start_codon:yes stop_codon:yes gene_type:complete